MTTRLKDIDGARTLTIDATSQPGRVYLIAKGMVLEFDRGLLEHALKKELEMERVVSLEMATQLL